MRRRASVGKRKWRVCAGAGGVAGALLAVLVAWGVSSVSALDIRPSVPAGDWLLMPEPKFMRPDVFRAIPGSERTLMAAAYWDDGEVRVMTRGEFEALGVGWDEFAARARGNIMLLLEALRPEMIRDSGGTLQCMLYRGDDHRIASLLFAPGLVQRYDPVFGPELAVIVPHRGMLFVFPKLAGRFEEFATDVLLARNNSAYPVSAEVFEVDVDGVRAVGVFEE